MENQKEVEKTIGDFENEITTIELNKDFLHKLQEDVLRIRSLCRSGAKSLGFERADPACEDAINNQYLAGDMALDVYGRIWALMGAIEDKGLLQEEKKND